MIVCDTGPLVAAALSNDSDHKACVELFTALHAAPAQSPVTGTPAAPRSGAALDKYKGQFGSAPRRAAPSSYPALRKLDASSFASRAYWPEWRSFGTSGLVTGITVTR